MATDIIARGMITEYKSGTNINFKENDDGSVTISSSGNVSSEDTVARDTIDNHKLDKNNPHNVTAEQVGLGNVNNTADLDKPISTAVQTALDDKANTKHTHKKSDITDFPNSLPANGGDADTVDGKHAGDFATSVNPTITGSIKIMGYSTNTVQSIFSDGDIIRIRNLDSETSQTNNYADIVITTSGVFTEKAVNGVWQGRKELLTSTCVTGTSTIVDSNNFVSANFGFTPSAVLYAVYDSKTGIDDNYRLALNFNSDGFITQSRTAPPIGGGIETFSYIAFR